MSIVAGSDALASDFIGSSAGAGDSGKVPKLNSDGELHNSFHIDGGGIIIDKNAGETIAGGTSPLAVYIKDADGELYKTTAANDDERIHNFIGFATSNGTDGNAMDVQTHGVVSGFTGLDAGKSYFLADTAGTISTTAGTYEKMVGIAISSTELWIAPFVYRGLTQKAQSITGIKTFGSIPVLPGSNPTTNNQAARKAYVDSFGLTNIAWGTFDTTGASGGQPSQTVDCVVGFTPKIFLLFWTKNQGCEGTGVASAVGTESCLYRNPGVYGDGDGYSSTHILNGKDTADDLTYGDVTAYGSTVTIALTSNATWGGIQVHCMWVALK